MLRNTLVWSSEIVSISESVLLISEEAPDAKPVVPIDVIGWTDVAIPEDQTAGVRSSEVRGRTPIVAVQPTFGDRAFEVAASAQEARYCTGASIIIESCGVFARGIF